MIKKGAFFIFVLVFIFSCKKEKSEPTPEPPTPQPTIGTPKDTLANGWTMIDTKISDFFSVDILFSDINTGYLIGGTTTTSVMYKTTDGGLSWTEVLAARMRNRIAHFSNLGISKNRVFITSSTNKVYSILNDSSLDSTTYSEMPTDLQFINGDTGYLVTINSLYQSINAGASWSKLFSANSSNLFSALCFRKTGKSWLGIGNNLYSSKGAVIDYVAIPFTLVNSSWQSMSAPSDRLVYFSSSTGLFKYSEGSLTVEPISLSFALTNYIDLYFETESVGYLTTGNRIMKTIDGGRSWKTEVVLINNVSIVEIDAIGDNIWACCSNGKVLRYKP